MTYEKAQTSVIFLSHHSSKEELVAHLSTYLEKNGLQTWYAKKSIHSGEQWDEAIHVAIQNCRAVVLLFCAQADSSRQVKRELALADKYKKPVFWLKIERVEPNNLSYFLTSTQWLDWLDTRDDTLEKLVYDISHIEIKDTLFQIKPNASQAYARNQVEHFSWVKGVLTFETDRQAAECAAYIYFSMAHNQPDSSVILPTGRSATIVFRAMLRVAREYDDCPFGEAHIISDTETFGVSNDHESSRTRHINEMLINPLKKLHKAPDNEQLDLLSGIYTNSDPIKNVQKNIRMFPPSVHAISISPVGEIIAYEVGTYNNIDDIIDDAPRIVEVGEHTKKYIDPNQPSKSIITIGLGTVLSSEILLILVFDIQKVNILNRLFNGPMTAGIPATLLRKHPNAFILTTDKIALEAKIDEYAITYKNAKEAAEWLMTN